MTKVSRDWAPGQTKCCGLKRTRMVRIIGVGRGWGRESNGLLLAYAQFAHQESVTIGAWDETDCCGLKRGRTVCMARVNHDFARFA